MCLCVRARVRGFMCVGVLKTMTCVMCCAVRSFFFSRRCRRLHRRVVVVTDDQAANSSEAADAKQAELEVKHAAALAALEEQLLGQSRTTAEAARAELLESRSALEAAHAHTEEIEQVLRAEVAEVEAVAQQRVVDLAVQVEAQQESTQAFMVRPSVRLTVGRHRHRCTVLCAKCTQTHAHAHTHTHTHTCGRTRTHKQTHPPPLLRVGHHWLARFRQARQFDDLTDHSLA